MTDYPSFPTIGVKFSVFKHFVTINGGIDNFINNNNSNEPMITTDVCDKFLKPLTSESNQSYCELLQQQNSIDVGEATVFISHAWKYNFVDVIEALEHHFISEPDTFIWFDLFSNNQHESCKLPFEWWRDTFLNAIKKLGRVVLILSPWSNPIPLTRAWCLWEIYCAVKTNSKFEISITPSQHQSFITMITDDSGEFYKMLSNINVEKSECGKLEDKERIFSAVKLSVGMTMLNTIVIKKLREWVMNAINESLKDENISEVIIRDRLYAKASLLNGIGKYHESLEILEKCIQDFSNINEDRWYLTYSLLGIVYDSQGNFTKAIEYHEKSLEIKLKTFGEDHPNVANSYNNIGSLYDSQGNYTKAIEYYVKSLEIRLKTLGEDHPDVADSYNNIGNVYDSQGNYTKALEYYENSLEIRLKTFGEDHPNVADSYNNIGNVYDSQGNYTKALEYHEKSLEIRLITLGEDHPDVDDSYNNIGNVYDSQGNYTKAIEYYEKSLEI
jgi:tetratricopeptide (TPR) repeat protein